MTEWMRVAVRGTLALILGVLAWAVTRDYVLLADREALMIAGLTTFTVLCRPRSRIWRIVTALLLVLMLFGFWYLLRDRLADRNLVLVGLLVALTGLLVSGMKN